MSKEIEIEKKYRVLKLPENLSQYEYIEIEQSYLNKGGSPIRLRKFKTKDSVKCIFSKKVKSQKDLFECVEHNIELPENVYQELITAKEGRTIFKTRYKIPLDQGLIVDLDVFHDFFEGVCIAEIEYCSVEQANSYKVPVWLEELTSFENLTNSYMATKAISIDEYINFISIRN